MTFLYYLSGFVTSNVPLSVLHKHVPKTVLKRQCRPVLSHSLASTVALAQFELALLLQLLTGYEPCTLTWEPSRVQLKFLGFLCLLYQGISSRTQPPEAFWFLSKSCKWLDCVWANKVVGNNSKYCPRVLCTAHQDCCWSDLSSFLCTPQELQNRL